MSQPFEPIPESTQVHVDRLLGAQVGDYRVLERAGEGRLGTIYRAQHLSSGKAVSLQVLRTELIGNDEEAKAANAIKAPGVVPVLSFGQVSDGRRYRVMDPLEGEALDQLMQRKGKLSPKETIQLLDQVAVVLQAAHAWAVVHGNLGPSSVYVSGNNVSGNNVSGNNVSGDTVRLIDFGLARRKVTTFDDLRALGALGFTLMWGEELREGAPPPPLGAGIPEDFDRVLRELMEQRHVDATSARRELAQVGLMLDAPAPSAVAQPVKRSRAPLFAMLGLLLVGGAGAAFYFSQPAEPAFDSNSVSTPSIAEDDELLEDSEATPEQQPDQPIAPDSPEPRPRAKIAKTPRPVPSAEELYALTSQLESRLRKQPPRYGDDIDAALFVLNKQRLRLSGSPSLEERKDVAKQLAGWKRSYLRKK